MSLRIKHSVLLLVLASTALIGGVRAQDAGLPGGASTLSEAHGDWTVACALPTLADGTKQRVCAMAQEQFQAQSRQRVLAVELRPEQTGVKGTIVLPFGLALKNGVTYQLDDAQISTTQNFRTCLPIGCLLDVTFDEATVNALKAGQALKVNAVADGGQEMLLSISLAGFSSAYGRVVTLLQ